MSQQTWMIVAGVSLLVVLAPAFVWMRMPCYRWYCRACKKIVSTGRFHPARCTCGTQVLVAYFCRDCGSWHTTPDSKWHCDTCSSKEVSLGVEYSFATGLWRTRNRNSQSSIFLRKQDD
jgi:hypothetical protein